MVNTIKRIGDRCAEGGSKAEQGPAPLGAAVAGINGGVNPNWQLCLLPSRAVVWAPRSLTCQCQQRCSIPLAGRGAAGAGSAALEEERALGGRRSGSLLWPPPSESQ
jgi:hypothetical protein